MVLAIEPGLYIRNISSVPEQYKNIGIRIEDNVLVRDEGCEVLSQNLPKKAEDIEKIQQKYITTALLFQDFRLKIAPKEIGEAIFRISPVISKAIVYEIVGIDEYKQEGGQRRRLR